MKRWQTLLIDAANVLRENRWVRHYSHKKIDGEDAYCASGAIYAAQKNGNYSRKTFDRAYKAASLAVGTDIVQWNDRQAKNKHQVANVLEGASTLNIDY
jgi:hypothetical protein